MTLEQAILDVTLGLVIGLTLGLLGGGGSILTVPALVYLVGQSPHMAVTTSLMIVGTNSASGAFFHRTQGSLNGRVALIFGGTGMLMAYLAAGLSSQFSSTTLMVMFAVLMLVVGLVMIFRRTPDEAQCHQRGILVTVLTGGVVGLLTGFLGVGGGFLIVPALVMLVGLPMQQAVGTSLVVIAMNSLAGFLGHLHNLDLDYQHALLFTLAGFGGTFMGARLTNTIHPEQLKKLFAVFVIVLAVFLLQDNLL